MIPMTASEIAAAVGGRLAAGALDRRVEAVTIDSRAVPAASCFFAIVGERHDGHDFVADAIRAGAQAVVVQRPAAEAGSGVAVIEVKETTRALQDLAEAVRRRLDVQVVGITGSVGKTTTKGLTARLLATTWNVHSTPGNLNNHWGLPLSLLGLEERHRVMVAELAMSRPGEIRRLAEIAGPRVGVITNVAPAHMENFPDLDAVAAAKGELADALPSSGVLVVGADDPRTRHLGEIHAGRIARVIGFGRQQDAAVRAVETFPTEDGWRLLLSLPDDSWSWIDLRLPGEHSLANFLAAAAVAHALEVPVEAIAEEAPRLVLPPHRGGLRHLASGVRVIDDSYNASPLAMTRAIDTLAGLPTDGRRILVAGDMLELGEWAERAHREVGAHAALVGVDLLVAVGSRAGAVARGAREAGLPARRILVFEDAGAAARSMARRVGAGDVVLVKGSRAMGMERILAALETAAEPAAAGEA